MGKKTDFSEFYALADRFKDAESAERLEKVVEDILTDAGKVMLRRIEHENPHPSDTGLLRRTWDVGSVEKVGDGYSIKVYNNTEYAGYVEKGTRFMEGQYMLKTAKGQVANIDMPRLAQKHTKLLVEELMG